MCHLCIITKKGSTQKGLHPFFWHATFVVACFNEVLLPFVHYSFTSVSICQNSPIEYGTYIMIQNFCPIHYDCDKEEVCVPDTYIHICRGGWQKVIRAGFRWVEAVLMAGFIDRRQLNFISFPHRQ